MAAHPYPPEGLDLPGYVPQRLSQLEVLGPYCGASLLLILAVWLLSGRCGSRLSKADRLHMCWWALTGLTHIVVEGPFLFTPDFSTKSNPNYFDELSKEYGKSDSRYLIRDSTTMTVEGAMVLLEGPFSLLAVYAIASRKPYNHILQFTLCLGHLYASLFYFGTAYLDGFNFWVSPYYFWAYFIGANSLWVVMAFTIAKRSWKKICTAVQQAEKVKTK